MKRSRKNNGHSDFIRFAPTMLSLLALCCGVSAIKYSYSGHFMIAVSLILFACFLDGIDGRVARFFNVSSDFGVQIDSLADLVNFGVVPGFVIYCWKMNELDFNGISWFAVMLLACCMIIRLARFNVDLGVKDQNDPLVKYFFRGVPAPAAAGLVILPIILTFRFGYGFWSQPIFVVANTIITSLLAASTIPTPCFKKIKISEGYRNLFLIVATLFIILFVIDIWLAISIFGILYIASILVGIMFYLNFKRKKK